MAEDLMAGVSGSEPQPGLGGGLVSVGPDAVAQQTEPTSQTNEPSPTDGAVQGAAASDGTEAGKGGKFRDRINEIVGQDINGLKEQVAAIRQMLERSGATPQQAAMAAAAPGMNSTAGARFKADIEQFGVDVAMENYNKAMLGQIETRFERTSATSFLHGQPEAKDPDFVNKWEAFSLRATRQYPFLERLSLTSPMEAAQIALTLYRSEQGQQATPAAAAAKPSGNPAAISKEAVTSPGTGAGANGSNGQVWTPALFNQKMLEAMGIPDHGQRRAAAMQIEAEYDAAKATGRYKDT